MKLIPIKLRRPFVSVSLGRRLVDAFDLWARDVSGQMATYPEPQKLRHRFRTARERRGFFYHLRKGNIRVPYRRRGTLGRSWSVRTRSSATGIMAQVGSNANIAPYGPIVEGPGKGAHKQSKEMRRRGWPRIDDVARKTWKKHAPRIRAVFTAK